MHQCPACTGIWIDDGAGMQQRSLDTMESSNPAVLPRAINGLVLLAQLALIGLLVGLACWPLNLIDRWQDLILERLPFFAGGTWGSSQLLIACSPLVAMPLLLVLQATSWRQGAGSGIPQTMVSLEQPEHAPAQMASRSVVQRMVLWTIASLTLLPLGREGPVVQVGAAVAYQLRQRWPRLLERIKHSDLIALGAGAGLSGGFNTPFMGVVFVAEELTRRFAAQVIWPGLMVCVIAAEVSNFGGQPLFALGVVADQVVESSQLLWGALLGVIGGLGGGLFAWLLLKSTCWIVPRVRQQPWLWGLLLGGALTLLTLLNGGANSGDGEALMRSLLSNPDEHAVNLLMAFSRVIGPCLTLGAGIPGGLIDPAFAIGAALGDLVGQLSHHSVFCITFGMTAGLAGATQLPAMSLVFAIRMAGDQQLLPGVAMAAVIGSYMGRVWLHTPIYHALTELLNPKRAS